jgi:putative transposase
MPRRARAVFPGVPHHITQRGNHRERVFFEIGDENSYLSFLQSSSREEKVRVVAYCLMPNHVHLVLVPSTPEGLHHVLMSAHGQYAQRINRMRDQKGHLWQGRYFSSPLDANYFTNAVRYVELNPVRAGIVGKAEDYTWSSASAHCGLRRDPVLAPVRHFTALNGITDWSRWLADGIADESLRVLRDHASRNLPCGSSDFVTQLEQTAGRELRSRPRGGQTKQSSD